MWSLLKDFIEWRTVEDKLFEPIRSTGKQSVPVPRHKNGAGVPEPTNARDIDARFDRPVR